MWRIVRRCDDDPVGEAGLAPVVVSKNRVGNNRRGSIFVPFREHDFHAVGRQYFKSARQRRNGERMRIHSKKQRAVDPVLLSVEANRLTDGENVPLIESLVE